MKTCLWLSVGAPGKTPFRRRADACQGIAVCANWKLRRAAPVRLYCRVAPIGNRVRCSLRTAPCSKDLQTPAEACQH